MAYDQPEEPPSGMTSGSELTPDVEGSIYFVKDSAWGFEAAGREDHPGVCLWFSPEGRHATFLKGTSAESMWAGRGALIIEPSAANGLIKPTAFQLVPRRIPRRLVELMHRSPRRIGHIEPGQLAEMRRAVMRAHGMPGGGKAWGR